MHWLRVEAICDFISRDQFLESCSRELYVHLKPKTLKNLDEMANEADLFAEARGGVHNCTNKGQRDNRGAAQNHSKPDVNKGGGKQEIKCGICGKGHLTIKCYKNPNRMQASSAEVGNEAEGGDSDAKNEMQRAQATSDSFQNEGRGNSFGRGRNFPRGRGRGGNPPRGGGHQVNFCKMQIKERSENGIENICQSKGDNSINSMTKDKEGVCYFLKSRLPTARGTVNGKDVIVMRDTGCTGCVIRSSLVSKDQLLGKASDVTLINETTQRYPLALIDIDCPFVSGQTDCTFPTAKQPQSYNDGSVSDALTSEQRADVEALIEQYPDVLTSVPGRTDLIQHDIKLSTSEPIRSKGYLVLFKARDVMDSEIKEMLELGVIEKSVSPYSSPVVLVPKKDSSVRFCIEFRKLNKVAEFDAEPMPNMEEVINRMSGNKFFTRMDCSKGYWQVCLPDNCKHLTAFETPQGLFQFKTMPFGLINSGATFCRLMRQVLANVPNVDSFVNEFAPGI